jgi:hypothetical protein
MKLSLNIRRKTSMASKKKSKKSVKTVRARKHNVRARSVKKAVRKCSCCHKQGHNVRTCPKA